MAAYNPYNVAASGQNLLETLLGADQANLKGQRKVGEHKGEMKEEFQDEIIAAQKKQEEALAKQRKRKPWEKLLPLAGMFMGPLGSAIVGGLQGMYTTGKQSKHALGQIDKARDAGIDVGKWGKTFLGSGAKESKAASDLQLDALTRDAKVSGMDLLGTGLQSGISGYAMGKMGENIKGAFTEVPELDVFGPLEEGVERQGFPFLEPSKINPSTLPNKGFFEKLMKGLSQDPTTLLKEGGKGDAFKSLMMILSQMQGGRG